MKRPWKILPVDFYQRDPVDVARELLGKILVSNQNNQITTGTIIETEAYLSSDDPAAHSFIGKTSRNQSLFGSPGCAYIHRMHGWNLLDVTTEEIGKPSSVLIRALKPYEGVDIMIQRRKTKDFENLVNGPGKVCQALGIGHELDGIAITDTRCKIFIADGDFAHEYKIRMTPRIGISKGKKSVLRFLLTE
jgi:DNA-3-methyladenine glycosylase